MWGVKADAAVASPTARSEDYSQAGDGSIKHGRFCGSEGNWATLVPWDLNPNGRVPPSFLSSECTNTGQLVGNYFATQMSKANSALLQFATLLGIRILEGVDYALSIQQIALSRQLETPL
jgi:hypothetical protein